MLCGFVISQYDHANAIIHFEHSEGAKATAEARIKLRLDEERQRKLEAEEILKAIPDPSGATYFRNEANGEVEKVELAGRQNSFLAYEVPLCQRQMRSFQRSLSAWPLRLNGGGVVVIAPVCDQAIVHLEHPCNW